MDVLHVSLCVAESCKIMNIAQCTAWNGKKLIMKLKSSLAYFP